MSTGYDNYLREQKVRAGSKWGRKPDYDEIFKQTLRLTIGEVREFIGESKSICCMGIRTGTEAFEFKEIFPSAEVYGVDITELIKTIRTHLNIKIELQDFNNLPEDWEDKFDLVFSNSIDHAFEPEVTLREWWRVTKAGGYLLVEFSTTPENNIEHSFKYADLSKLLPSDKFEHTVIWEAPERNIIVGLFKVVK